MIEAQFDKVFDTQHIYRLLIDAMSRPGKINMLPSTICLTPPSALQKAAAAVAFTMLDHETGFCCLSSRHDVSDYIAINTGAAVQSVDAAEFIIFAGSSYAEISSACCGSLLSPEQGATLIIMVDRISNADGVLRLQLSGPGVKDSCDLFINGLEQKNLEIISQLNSEFPLGVDVIYTDGSGNIACVPRSGSMCWEVKG